jgi:acyl carrier protein
MTEEAKQMIDYILRRIRKPTLVIDENTPLVSSGLVDSMALGEVVLTLEDLTNTRIPPGAIKPKDLDTVAKMIATAQRVGNPRK